MKFSLKVKLEKLVNQYQKEMKEAFAKVKEIESSKLYSADGKDQLIRDIKATLMQADHEYNKALKDLIQVERSAVLNATISKPGDYQNMLTNALNQINMLGDKLTDKAAYDLVKPFFGDYETMHNLHSVISNRYGANGLNVTSRTIGIYDRMISSLDTLAKGTTYFFNTGKNMAIGLNFTLGSEMLLGEATNLDSMAATVEDLIRFKFEEAEASIKDSIKDEMFRKDGE